MLDGVDSKRNKSERYYDRPKRDLPELERVHKIRVQIRQDTNKLCWTGMATERRCKCCDMTSKFIHI